MGVRLRLPMFAVAAAMFGLMAVLATLQYRWLGRISDAERDRMSATLTTRAHAFAEDFDRELTRAYLLFQMDTGAEPGNAAARLSTRYDRWHATARYPRLISRVYLVSADDGAATIEQFDTTSRFLQPAQWPDSLQSLRSQLTQRLDAPPAGKLVIRAPVASVLEDGPAIVVPTPVILFERTTGAPEHRLSPVRIPLTMTYTVLMLDRDYVVGEMLPALAAHHFRGAGDGFDYRLAVVSNEAQEVVYHSAADFTPAKGTKADASIGLFQVKPQEFGALAAEVRRFTTFFSQRLPGPSPEVKGRGSQLSVIVQSPGTLATAEKHALTAGIATSSASRNGVSAKWTLLVKHPAGSLETAVQNVRRRNVLVSSGILAVLGASMALLVLSTRRAQRLAAQQMEFVAAVSHELRTPLAVIRSAAENLADGVVRDDEQIRKYGDLVRNEGRRLTEMVEQILELAGIHSGRRGFALHPIALRPLLEEVVERSRALAGGQAFEIAIDVPADLPPALGDDAALERVFQNLIANAIKYGGRGGWIGIRGRAAGRELLVSIADRGIGIAAAEQTRIFEPFYRTPDVVAAQIQGAGLGLSLVKQILDGHGGRVTVRSAPGEGSEFTVHLPVATEQPLPAGETDPQHAAAHAATLRS